MKAKFVSPLLLLVFWEIAVRAGWLDERLIAPPSVVFVELWRLTMSGELGAALAVSLERVVCGFAIASVVGVALGALMARVRIVEIAIDPLVELFRPVSPLALFPLFILWFGIGEISKIFIIAFSCIFPIILNTYAGVRSIDARLFRATR
jgi:sulfonate transport system permease protein